jgi:hypothetical protein
MRGVEAANIRAIEVSQTARAADASAVDASAVETAEVRAVNPRRAAADATKLCATEPGASARATEPGASARATKPGSSSAEVRTTTAAAEMASATTARRGKFSSQKCDAAERKTCRKNFEDLVRHNAHSRQSRARNLIQCTTASLMYVNNFKFQSFRGHATGKIGFNKPFWALGKAPSAYSDTSECPLLALS